MLRTKSRADHGVAVYAYRTPCWLEEVEMAAAMLFPGWVAVKPLEAEETVLYLNRPGAL
jgi:hypothetical protein